MTKLVEPAIQLTAGETREHCFLMKRSLNNVVNSKRRIFIFGAGRNAEKLYKILVNKKQVFKVEAFVDNNPQKWGEEFFGKIIISAEQLKKEITSEDIVILSMNDCDEVGIQLRQMGIEQNMMISIHEYFDILAEEAIIRKKEDRNCREDVIRVGFLTQEIQSWDKTAPVYEAMKKSKKFLPFLFVVPFMDFKTLEVTNESYLSLFKKLYPQDRIFLTNGQTDISEYDLDYLFMTAPYDEYYPSNLQSSYLAEQVLLCYIPYGYNGAYNFIPNSTIRSFFRNIYISFTDTVEVREALLKVFGDSVFRKNRKFLDLGYPSLEQISLKERFEQKERVIMWTPRWSYSPKIGGSHFFEYYDFMSNIMELYPDSKLIFRPHPMMFDTFVRKGILDNDKVEEYKSEIADKGIILDENSDINIALDNTSILISDFSTVIMQFFMTGKPIIYCASEIIQLNYDYSRLMEGIYIARNELEIKNALRDIIERGDPLKSKREEIRNEFCHKFKGSIDRILETLENDRGGLE